MEPKIAVHGGASSLELNEEMQYKIEVLTKEGKDLLQEGEMSMDVVEYIVNELEDDPRFNAGLGGKLDFDGVPRTEAGIMDDNMDAGAAIGLEGIRYAISVARKVMEESNNTMIGGPHSTKFAQEYGFDKEDLKTDKSVNIWNEVRSKITSVDYKDQVRDLKELDEKAGGTVGCVALDKNGGLASATSTGGRNYQLPNRIGDSPIVGSGFYCTEDIAVSTTGVGESIMKVQLARNVSYVYNKTNDLDIALEESLEELDQNTEGKAGIIAVSSNGEASHNYNTKSMHSDIR